MSLSSKLDYYRIAQPGEDELPGFRNFKAFYHFLQGHHQQEFPHLLSYNRFVEWMPRLITPLTCYLSRRLGNQSGIAFVDSTPIRVCNNKRIGRHRVFKGVAARGRSTMGWFYGFKLHLIVSDTGELLGVRLTPGNVDDRKPVPDMARHLRGKLYGDKGYISQNLFEQLLGQGLQLITSLRVNMKPKLVTLWDKLMLRKRSVIETINDQLKNISQIEHTRHRSQTGFMVNMLAGLIAYTHQPKKPSIQWTKAQETAIQCKLTHQPLLLIA